MKRFWKALRSLIPLWVGKGTVNMLKVPVLQFFDEKIRCVRVFPIVDSLRFGRDKAGFSVEKNVSRDDQRAGAKGGCGLAGYIHQSLPKPSALKIRMNADRPERKRGEPCPIGAVDPRMHIHDLPDDPAFPHHHQVEFGHKLAARAETMQDKMLGASRTVNIPERIAHQLFCLEKIFRLFLADQAIFK